MQRGFLYARKQHLGLHCVMRRCVPDAREALKAVGLTPFPELPRLRWAVWEGRGWQNRPLSQIGWFSPFGRVPEA